ncbi:hypothetical protein GGQ85_000182 [Nitrobacter vulgaris]|uniref:hypothetical protein n=1 Tax=Nitrobacter vulgaris TaxID=29421 RepID=UPI00285C43F1|nr:hypothetical protein [Nitrobacter vulgaris]MDR6302511.1 hypothetical protein [Nitrobacter vulgaris]
MTEKPATSPEAEIVRQIEILIRKLATDQATPRDMQLLQDLQKVRVNLMRPKILALNEKGASHADDVIRAFA